MRFFFILALALAKSVYTQAAGPDWPTLDHPRYWIVEPKGFLLRIDSGLSYTTGNYNSRALKVNPDGMDEVDAYKTPVSAMVF